MRPLVFQSCQNCHEYSILGLILWALIYANPQMNLKPRSLKHVGCLDSMGHTGPNGYPLETNSPTTAPKASNIERRSNFLERAVGRDRLLMQFLHDEGAMV